MICAPEGAGCAPWALLPSWPGATVPPQAPSRDAGALRGSEAPSPGDFTLARCACTRTSGV